MGQECATVFSMDLQPLPEARADLERQTIERALTATMGNVTQAAELLGMTRQWLHARLRGDLSLLGAQARAMRLKRTGRATGKPSEVPLPATEAIQETLAAHGGNLSATARAMGVPRTTLHHALYGRK